MTSTPSKSASARQAPPDSTPPKEKGAAAEAAQTMASSDAPLGLLALHLLERWHLAGSDGLMFVCEDERRAEQLGAVLHALDPRCGVMVLPSLSAAPFDDIEPSREIAGRRSSVLRRLAGTEAALLIATPQALSWRVPAPDVMQKAAKRLARGETFDDAEIREFLLAGGYIVDERIEMPGSALFLGNALEIFPAGALGPVRIGFDGGVITDIHEYNLDDQRETGALDDIIIDVVEECDDGDASADGKASPRRPGASVFDYLPAAQVVVDHGADARARRWFGQIDKGGRKSAGRFLTAPEWDANTRGRGASILPETWPAADIEPFYQDASPTRSFRRFLAAQSQSGMRVVFTAASERDLRAMDRRAGTQSTPATDWEQALRVAAKGRAALVADLERGFVSAHHKVAVIAAADLLGSRAAHQDVMAVGMRQTIAGGTLAPGDVVIHLQRGMAILRDLATVSAAGVPESEMLRLEFADEDQVLLPLSDLREIWRYSADSAGVSLDKADGSSWPHRRRQAEEDIAATASRIAERIAERATRTAPRLVPPIADYENFTAGFGYVPTVDQANATRDVLSDLASEHPMDRLICGDVGYGKTEVALRATAAAVFAGWQVAIAVPTTVLARQHLETFRQRFEPFGIAVGLLSRFTPAAEARKIKKALADGSLSVVIGTHALVGKGVTFARLGLLVIDEEQHFGRAHKAKLAALATDLHLLTMTATPIPRTLNEASVGLRSLSVIATPPVRRIPVKTAVEPFNDATVAAALRREHRRRGQSFVVCPRIEDIAPMAQRIADLAPELTSIVVHGKMPAADIDSAMIDFAAGKADILLATNIIESGLDLPRGNTIVVSRPDKFGLAQLHQLRGRVGRRSTRAYALFLTDPDAPLSPAAVKRLATLQQLDHHGAGFLISAGDMDQRGGGDLLSDEQSGHLQMLGSELSAHLLQRAIGKSDLAPLLDSPPELHLDVPALFPSSYINDSAIRLGLYARIFKCASERELETLEEEIEERFGELPIEASNLIALSRLQIECLRMQIAGIEAGPKSLAVTFSRTQTETPIDDDSLEWKDGRLIYRRPSTPAERMAAVGEFLTLIAAMHRGAEQGAGSKHRKTTEVRA